MAPLGLSDTSPLVVATQRALIRAAAPSERLERALALSDLARKIALAGATRVAGAGGRIAIRRRFLAQTYGPGIADWVEAREAAKHKL